jgi:hypothetical protein
MSLNFIIVPVQSSLICFSSRLILWDLVVQKSSYHLEHPFFCTGPGQTTLQLLELELTNEYQVLLSIGVLLTGSDSLEVWGMLCWLAKMGTGDHTPMSNESAWSTG